MQNKKQVRLALLERQVGRIEKRVKELDRQDGVYKSMEASIVLFGLLFSILLILLIHVWGLLGFVLIGVVFFFVNKRRRKINLSYLKHETLLQIYTTNVARMKLDWEHISPEPFDDIYEDHPFEMDLDITGDRSLHRLLNITVSEEGCQLLRDWLLETEPDREEIYARQDVIRELIPMTRFRHKFLLYSLFATRYARAPLDREHLLAWLDEDSGPGASLLTLSIGIALSALMFMSLILYVFAGLSPLFCIVLLALSLIWFLVKRGEIGYLAGDTDYLRRVLSQLEVIFAYLERYPYKRNVHLKQLCEPFYLHPDHRPSVLLAQVARLANRANLQQNAQAWTIANTLVPVGMYVSYRFKKYKTLVADLFPDWLDAWFELEALCSLANFAYLNPDYTLPKIVSEKKLNGGLLFEAKEIGHPLLPMEKKVVNHVAFSKRGEMLLITGSNMAGKSTFLRTLGINLCLAYAGGPVNATSFQCSLFELFTCIRVTDSVTDGYSYFYAEVRRLKKLLERLEQHPSLPLFFLIDEIFKGTNNQERVMGSNAYVHELSTQNCIGVVSTHDLELVPLTLELPNIGNYHFSDDIINGKLVFDYKLRPGPSPTTNALKIMALEGLPTQVRSPQT